jgi:anti-sigma factor ChrR (cupin superfamily)
VEADPVLRDRYEGAARGQGQRPLDRAVPLQPGSELALHEHVEVEQTFVIEGSLVDDEGEVTAGNYVWRPKGNRHIAKSPNGALVLSIFLKPNIFLTGDSEGQQLR